LTAIQEVDPGVQVVDLNFQGLPRVIAAFILVSGGEIGLVETGPSTTLPALLAALEPYGGAENLAAVAVTHIHLDHAGAVGTLMRLAPDARCYVHSVGAPHLIDPSRLLRSAGRIYGDRMGTLWGEVFPAPESRVTAVKDGDLIRLGGSELRVMYTPGHASHHIALYDESRRAVFTGDVAGVRMPGCRHVRPPTPPPDINIHQWNASVDRLRALDAQTLLMTHFGAQTEGIEAQYTDLLQRLDSWTGLVRAGLDRDEAVAGIVNDLRSEGDWDVLATGGDETTVRQYELASPYEMSVDGLIREVERSRRGSAK
jgi:glyoxylase-like metal-dependent hydrolase (beta-lactamase superfamily II)